MIKIEISKCHCDIVHEALYEAIPNAKKAGIEVDQVLEMIQNPDLLDEHTVYLNIEDDIWQTIMEILRCHPQPDVGSFFIHHLENLAEDSLLGYND